MILLLFEGLPMLQIQRKFIKNNVCLLIMLILEGLPMLRIQLKPVKNNMFYYVDIWGAPDAANPTKID